MLSLSPAKLLVVLIVALIVLGPEKLPGMARQVGATWADLRRLRGKLESEVRGVFPDLPSSHEVAQAVRSPLTFLDRLADEHGRSEESTTTGAGAGDGAGQGDGAATDARPANGSSPAPPAARSPWTPDMAGDAPTLVPDDPSMN